MVKMILNQLNSLFSVSLSLELRKVYTSAFIPCALTIGYELETFNRVDGKNGRSIMVYVSSILPKEKFFHGPACFSNFLSIFAANGTFHRH